MGPRGGRRAGGGGGGQRKSWKVKKRKEGKSLNDMIESREVKYFNVSIMEKCGGNGYKGAGRRPEREIGPKESPQILQM